MIFLKTEKAFSDLPLILSKLEPHTNRSYWINPYGGEETYMIAVNELENYATKIMQTLYYFHYKRLVNDRQKRQVKLEISEREVWKAMNSSIKKMKQIIREQKSDKRKAK
jgi:hypothetical protein